MACFLIGHIFYILSFGFFVVGNFVNFLLFGILLIILILLISVITIPKFKNGLGDMKIPVLVYMNIIILMHVFTILRLSVLKIYCPCFCLVYIGSIFFILSDSLIALDQFGESKVHSVQFYIDLTYILGQFLIVQGVILTGYPLFPCFN